MIMEKYEELEMEVIVFEEDIITSSVDDMGEEL